MARDYIPSSDTGFQAWAANFVTYANENLAGLGLTAADMAAITNYQMDFSEALTNLVTAQQSAQAARQTKDDYRDQLETEIRQLVRRLQASPQVEDSERAALGITVPDTVRTMTMSVGGIDSRPLGVVDTSQRLRHEIRFSDEATPTSRAKPAGVMGCEIWVKVLSAGEAAPAGSDGLSFLSLDTSSPYIAEYEGNDGGKTAHYMLRWVKKNGDKGPWSETISATITA